MYLVYQQINEGNYAIWVKSKCYSFIPLYYTLIQKWARPFGLQMVAHSLENFDVAKFLANSVTELNTHSTFLTKAL